MDTEPLFVAGGPIGCLLLHGLSGNPADLRPLADKLIADGYTVHVPMLPGHGPTPEGSGRSTARDWIRAVAQAHNELAAVCDHVILIGHSMGGLLAIRDAVRRAPDGLVLLAVPTFVGNWRTRFLPFAKYLVRWWYPLAEADFSDPQVRERMSDQAGGVNLDDPQVQQYIRRSVRIPTNAIDHFFRLMRRTRPLIHMIDVPTLIVHGLQDTTALPICAEEIYRELQSASKKLVWFDATGHQMLAGKERASIIQTIVSWIPESVGELDYVS